MSNGILVGIITKSNPNNADIIRTAKHLRDTGYRVTVRRVEFGRAIRARYMGE